MNDDSNIPLILSNEKSLHRCTDTVFDLGQKQEKYLKHYINRVTLQFHLDLQEIENRIALQFNLDLQEIENRIALQFNLDLQETENKIFQSLLKVSLTEPLPKQQK